MEVNNCFPNYRCGETTVKATVCFSLLGENWVIECSAEQINDMVFATWQLVLIIVGKGGLLHIVYKHWYDLMKWSQFSLFTTKSLKKNGLICIGYHLVFWSYGQIILQRKNKLKGEDIPEAWPQLTLSFSVSEKCSAFGDRKQPKICCLSCPSFLHGTISLTDFPSKVFLQTLHQQLCDALIFQWLRVGEQDWRVVWNFLQGSMLKRSEVFRSEMLGVTEYSSEPLKIVSRF